MSDRWTELLSDYLDGELSDAVRQELEIHLLDCAECRATLDGLSAVVEAAGRLTPRQPPGDVWAGIAARIAAERTHEGRMSGEPSDFVSRLRHRLSRPQIAAAWMPVTAFVSFAIRYRPTIPQVAAAAAVVALLSAGTTWLLLTGGTQRAPAAAGAGSASAGTSLVASPESASVGYADAIAQLEQALAEYRDRLDPATVQVVEANLAVIDQAIDEAQRALREDPADPYLRSHLQNVQVRKLELLERLTEIARADI